MLVVNSTKVAYVKVLSLQAIRQNLKFEEGMTNSVYYIRIIPERRKNRRLLMSPITISPVSFSEEDIHEVYCEIGEVSLSNMSLIIGNINYDKFFIEDIYIWKRNNVNDFIYIVILVDKDNNERKFKYEFINDYNVLFDKILPDINKRLKNGECWEDINFHYYYNYWYNKIGFFSSIHEDELFFESVLTLNMVPQVKRNRHDWVKPKVIITNKYTYNKYIFDYLRKFLYDVSYEYKDCVSNYIGYADFLPDAILEEMSLGYDGFTNYHNYIELYILLDAISYFDRNICEKCWERNESFNQLLKTKHPVPIRLWRFYNFIKQMRIWDYYDGERRVGRDDLDYNELIVVIPVLTDYRLKEKMIELINSIFEIKLEYQEQNSRYYAYKKYNVDWTSTFTGREGNIVLNHKYIVQILREIKANQDKIEEYI